MGGAEAAARIVAAGKKPLPKPSSKPMPKPAPKPKAINEESQVIDADQVVNWHSVKLQQNALQNALENLRHEQHVKLRCPRFEELYMAVQAKLQDPQIQAFKMRHHLEDWEAECILACPAEPRPRFLP